MAIEFAEQNIATRRDSIVVSDVNTVRGSSIGAVLKLANDRPAGFDYLRLALSIAVICIHSPLTSYGSDLEMWVSPLRPFVRLILPMFFALSGFLIAGSLLRCVSVFQFLTLRAIRIYPALLVEALISALLLGPLVTNLSLSDYFTNILFYKYLLNITGHIQYLLPGVFSGNPFKNIVNAQLWTVPYELFCYLAVAVLFAGIKRHRWTVPAAAAALTLIYTASKIREFHGFPPVIEGRVSGLFLIVSFLMGISLYLYKDEILWSKTTCVLSGLAGALLLSVVPNGDYIASPFVAYFTVSLGISNPPRATFLKGADYSYGIFLYGFVIQQTLMHAFPWARVWWINIAMTLPCAVITAAISWHFIEKPALRLKTMLPKRLFSKNPV